MKQDLPPIPLIAAVQQYVATNPRVTSTETARRYRTTANTLGAWLGREALSSDLTVENYGKWVQWRREVVAPGTARGDAEKLLVLWKYLAMRGLAEYPNVLLPKKTHLTPQTFTDDELRRLWRAAATTGRRVGMVPGHVYWPALLQVMYETAERFSAVMEATWNNIDLNRGTIYFPAETRKGGCSDSLKMLRSDTLDKLRSLHEHTRGAKPFAPGVVPATVRKGFELLLAEANIEHGRRKKFHGLRSRAASDITAGGGDAALHLGHSDPRITRQSYIDPTIAQTNNPVNLLYSWQDEPTEDEAQAATAGFIAASIAGMLAWLGK